MGGGLIQLKYLGKESEFFVGNPQISFFKSVFRSYNNYSKELIDVIFESPIDFNKSTYANIPIHADMIQDIYLNLNIKLNVSTVFDLTITENTFASTKDGVFYEYNSAGVQELFLFNYIYSLTNINVSSFIVNEIGTSTSQNNLYNEATQRLDLTYVTNHKLYYSYVYNFTAYSGEFYIRPLNEDLTKLIKQVSFEIDEYVVEKHNTDWFLIYNSLFNNNETLNKVNEELKYVTPKMFNRNIQLYVPLRFFFTKQSQSAFPIAALYRSDVNIRLQTNNITDVFMGNKIISSVTFNKAVLSVNYIHLDKEEKNYFLKNKHELLIEQLQHQEDKIINGMYNNVELHFSFLSKYVLWKLPYKYILDKAKIIFNNNDLFYEQNGEYFHLIQPFEHNLGNTSSLSRMEENQDRNGTYYLYSFCLHPQNKQPSGLCNMSRIDEKFLQLRTYYIKDDLETYNRIPIDIYSVNYNFLHIEKGKCKLQF